MSRLVLRLELATVPNEQMTAAERVIDLGLLAPSLSPAEIGEVTLSWARQSTTDLMDRLREKEKQK